MEFKILNDTNDEIKELRTQTFVVEKNVPEDIEFDGKDAEYKHFCLYDGEKLVACLRGAFEDNNYHIGRVAVAKELRGKGAGRMLINHLCDYLKDKNCEKIVLGAIDSAVGFYEKMGFRAKGEYFMEAGHPHINMEKRLK